MTRRAVVPSSVSSESNTGAILFGRVLRPRLFGQTDVERRKYVKDISFIRNVQHSNHRRRIKVLISVSTVASLSTY